MATKNLKLIQTGDWHLFGNIGNWSIEGYENRQHRLKKCLQEILKASKNADFLLLTGDLFDEKNLFDETFTMGKEGLLKWLDKELSILGKNKIIVTFGSHDKTSRDWFESRSAERNSIGRNSRVSSIKCPNHDVIFYAVDSIKDQSCSQSNLIKKAVEEILNARKREDSKFGRAILLSHISGDDLKLLKPLDGFINYCALGHRHFFQVIKERKPYAAFSGAPVGRDIASHNDNGQRYFIRTEITQNGLADPREVPLKNGGYQIQVIESEEAIWCINGHRPNIHKVELGELGSLSKRIFEKIDKISEGKCTSVALAKSVEKVISRKDLLEQIRKNYEEETWFISKGNNKGNVYYFIRKIQSDVRLG